MTGALFTSQKPQVGSEQNSNMIVLRCPSLPLLPLFFGIHPSLSLSHSLTKGAGASTTSLLISALGGEVPSKFSFSTEISLQTHKQNKENKSETVSQHCGGKWINVWKKEMSNKLCCRVRCQGSEVEKATLDLIADIQATKSTFQVGTWLVHSWGSIKMRFTIDLLTKQTNATLKQTTTDIILH